jgi:hypothetical protein
VRLRHRFHKVHARWYSIGLHGRWKPLLKCCLQRRNLERAPPMPYAKLFARSTVARRDQLQLTQEDIK